MRFALGACLVAQETHPLLNPREPIGVRIAQSRDRRGGATHVFLQSLLPARHRVDRVAQLGQMLGHPAARAVTGKPPRHREAATSQGSLHVTGKPPRHRGASTSQGSLHVTGKPPRHRGASTSGRVLACVRVLTSCHRRVAYVAACSLGREDARERARAWRAERVRRARRRQEATTLARARRGRSPPVQLLDTLLQMRQRALELLFV